MKNESRYPKYLPGLRWDKFTVTYYYYYCYYYYYYYYYLLQSSFLSVAVVPTLVQTKEIRINISNRNNTKTQYKQYKTQ